jgi:preprotein translocase subunit YajC
MRQKVTNHSGLARGLMGQLAAEKKKAVTTLCLILVMAFMWLRVLTKNAPEASQASLITGQLNSQDQVSQELNVSFIELPKVAGRNDVITRDFFTSNGWRYFGNGQKEKAVIEEVNIVSKNGNEEVIRKVAEKLKLEATVVLGTNPRAYINDKVVSVGDKVLIRDGIDTYECEVIEIKENTVVIKCREAEVTLKLTQASMIEN